MNLLLEITAVIFGLAYLYFLMKEQIVCWVFGVISSLLSIILFYKSALYSESILYVYYVIVGVYGFYYWNRGKVNGNEVIVTDLPIRTYIQIILFGEVLALVMGFVFSNYTDANAPYLDAHTTIFSFIASYLEVKKYLASWKFWIIINALTIVLYLGKDLNYYTMLTIVYLTFSFIGYRTWKLKLNENKLISNN